MLVFKLYLTLFFFFVNVCQGDKDVAKLQRQLSDRVSSSSYKTKREMKPK